MIYQFIRFRGSTTTGILQIRPIYTTGFRFQRFVCNGCYDIIMISMDLSNVATINIKRVDYRCIIQGSKEEAINLINNSVLDGVE